MYNVVHIDVRVAKSWKTESNMLIYSFGSVFVFRFAVIIFLADRCVCISVGGVIVVVLVL